MENTVETGLYWGVVGWILKSCMTTSVLQPGEICYCSICSAHFGRSRAMLAAVHAAARAANPTPYLNNDEAVGQLPLRM